MKSWSVSFSSFFFFFLIVFEGFKVFNECFRMYRDFSSKPWPARRSGLYVVAEICLVGGDLYQACEFADP